LEGPKFLSVGACSKRQVVVSLVLLAFGSVSAGVWAGQQPIETGQSKQEVLREVGRSWMAVAARQFQRGYYDTAQKSLLHARDYYSYLEDEDHEYIDDLLNRITQARSERAELLQHIKRAKTLIKQNRPIEAKAHLLRVKDNDLLTDREKQLVLEGLAEVNKEIEQRRNRDRMLYTESVRSYNAWDYERARKGFLEVAQSGLLVTRPGESAEDYLAKISKLQQRVPEPRVTSPPQQFQAPASAEQESIPSRLKGITDILFQRRSSADKKRRKQPEAEPPAQPAGGKEPSRDVGEMVAAAEPLEGLLGAPEKLDRKTSVVRSYTKAVVADALTRARDAISRREYDKALQAVAEAEQIVFQNHSYLGDNLFQYYVNELDQLRADAARGRSGGSKSR